MLLLNLQYLGPITFVLSLCQRKLLIKPIIATWHVCKLEGETELIHVIQSISQSSMASVTPAGKRPGVYYPVLSTIFIFIPIFHLFSDLVAIVGAVVVGVGTLALVVLEAEGGLH